VTRPTGLEEKSMVATDKSLFELTAADLMTRNVVTLREWQPLREAAEELFRAGVHGAPVVDVGGRCVGVLSVSDLARWEARRTGPAPTRPMTCGFQESYRAIQGEERTLCTLPEGKCPLQSPKTLRDGRQVQVCRDPHCVCLEWQMVEIETLPAEDVRHYMTHEPVTAEPEAPIRSLARQMIDAAVQRVIIIDSAGGPVGIVSATDLVAALAGSGETADD
jgi:CBS-domain-containing membrane protein